MANRYNCECAVDIPNFCVVSAVAQEVDFQLLTEMGEKCCGGRNRKDEMRFELGGYFLTALLTKHQDKR